ncbi:MULTISPECIES: hypothetical protein [Salinibaculum]|uniref:hypothetical protein n=1 Tax=Salinibaculum TaxID=2732368 RepID=UPI0030CF06EC
MVGLLALAGTYLVAGGLGLPTATPADGEVLNRSVLVQPDPGGSYLWPYTSRERSPEGRTLATNLVVHGDDERVRRVLTERSALDWELAEETNETAANASVANASAENASAPAEATADARQVRVQPVEFDQSLLSWNDAHGSTRYSYIDARPVGGEARWVDETFQVHAGNYFGGRYHIRAYTLPETSWTAIQVHREYWDWFRLRHTVTDIRDSRTRLEKEFIGQPYVRSVSREYYGVERGWNDGWLSTVRMVPGLAALLVGGLLSLETRRSLVDESRRFLRWSGRNVRGIVLATALAAVYLGVRSVAVVMELAVADVDPRVFLAVLYPAIAVGLPALAFGLGQPFGATSRFERIQRVSRWLGPRLDPLPAFGFVVAGLGGAFVLDFGGLGVRSIPIQLALHRVGLTVALGLVAAGATRIDDRGAGLIVVGVVGWLLGLVMPLLGYV